MKYMETIPGGGVSYVEIDKIMRIAYTYREFCKTSLYRAMRRWEGENPEYPVFAEKEPEKTAG